MNILICSQYGEAQVEEVCKHLKVMGANPVVFERYRKDQCISYHYEGSTSGFLRVNNKEYALTSEIFPAIWYRPKPIILGEIPGGAERVEEHFCFQEWRVILQSLDILLSKSYWINEIGSNHRAANKAYQLNLAKEIGLDIPKTVITNDVDEVLKLFEKPDNKVIYKTLSSFFTMNYAIYTNLITIDQLMKSKLAILMAPGIFQKYVEKKYELRVTIVGEKFFIVKINSQLKKESSIDWRKAPEPRLYEIGELSTHTKTKLLCLQKRLGIVYGAYDFIVDREGREIFLECNPSGQWLWLENTLSMGISQAMANQLIQRGEIHES